jgi:hypothetical protein
MNESGGTGGKEKGLYCAFHNSSRSKEKATATLQCSAGLSHDPKEVCRVVERRLHTFHSHNTTER